METVREIVEIVDKYKNYSLENFCEEFNIKIHNLNIDNSLAFTYYDEINGINNIHISKNHNYKDFVLMHEIGHIVLNHKSNPALFNPNFNLRNRCELQANIFAVLMLNPIYQDCRDKNSPQYAINKVLNYLSSCVIDKSYIE